MYACVHVCMRACEHVCLWVVCGLQFTLQCVLLSSMACIQNFETVTGSIPISVSEGILELESELTAVIELLQSP